MKLNLGCGELLLDDYLNVDKYDKHAQLLCDVKKLPFKSESIEGIYSSHLIEHFDFQEGYGLAEEWFRVLKKGGRLAVETPDFVASCQALVEAPEYERYKLYPQFFARPWVEGQTHKFLYTEAQLCGMLGTIGFSNFIRVVARRYIDKENINLRIECIK